MGCLNSDGSFSHWFGNIHLSGPCNRKCYFCIGQHMMALDGENNLDTWPLKNIDGFVVTRCLEILGHKFGYTVNSKGHKVLNNVRVIQGDGINHDSIIEILMVAKDNGWSASNIAFGMGGALLQGHNRDTQKFAMKCSSITVNGEDREVYKDPIDDHGKVSKKGRLDTEYFEGYRATVLKPGQLKAPYSVMQTVYENGEILSNTTLAEVRERASKG